MPHMKIGTIGFLILAVAIVNPELKMPAFSQFVAGGGPIIPGPLFPFAFITIACGAISGFHALIASGTTPKMIDRESDIRPIGYGAMLVEGLVGIVSLIAATAMFPGDYFAINTPPSVFANLGIPIVNLPDLQLAVGETVTGRPGGAVSLAIGIAQIFSGLPGMAAPKSAMIIRQPPGGARVEIPANLSEILSGKQHDVELRPDDILFVPTNVAKSAVVKTIQTAIQAATSAVIYRGVY